MYRHCIVILIGYGISVGFSQMIRNDYICRHSSKFSECNNGERYRSYLRCPSHHVFLLTGFSVLAFNESDEKSCCTRIPENSCGAEYNFSLFYGMLNTLSRCSLSPSCYFYSHHFFYGHVNLTNDCSATNYMLHLDHTCVTNSTIVNMTQPTANTSIGEISLSYMTTRYPYYPKINESFYCSCEVTTPDDVSIYPYVYSIFLDNDKRYNNKRYNTSLSIYTRNWDVLYDQKNQNMLVTYDGSKCVIYRRLNVTLGPIYVVYSGEELPYYDRIWVNFKVLEGKIRTKCDGCKRGKHSPPTFNRKTEIKNDHGGKKDIRNNHTAKDSVNIFKNAFITLVVVVAIVGITVLVGFLFWRKRRKLHTTKQQGVADLPLRDRGRENGTRKVRSKGRGGAKMKKRETNLGNEASVPAVVSNIYDSIDRNQPSTIYDNLSHDNIYDN